MVHIVVGDEVSIVVVTTADAESRGHLPLIVDGTLEANGYRAWKEEVGVLFGEQSVDQTNFDTFLRRVWKLL